MGFQQGKLVSFLQEQTRTLLLWGKEKLRNPDIRSRLTVWILLLSIAFMALIFYRNIDVLRQQELRLDFRSLLLALAAFSLGFIPTSFVWHNLLRLMGVRLPYLLNLKYYCLSSLPRHIPGVFVYVTSRSLLYEEQQVDAKQVVAASTLEILFLSLVGLLMAFGIFSASSLSMDSAVSTPAMAVVFGLLFLMMVLFFLFFRKRISKGVDILPQLILHEKTRLIVTLFWILVSWTGGGVFLFFVINTVAPLSWASLPLVIAIWSASGAMGMALDAFTSGLGVRVLSLGAMLNVLISPVSSIVVAVGINLIFIAAEIAWIGLLLALVKTLLRSPAVEK